MAEPVDSGSLQKCDCGNNGLVQPLAVKLVLRPSNQTGNFGYAKTQIPTEHQNVSFKEPSRKKSFKKTAR